MAMTVNNHIDIGLSHIVGIKARDLVLGAEYQRQLLEDHAMAIAEKFDVRKALVVVVNVRFNGDRYVIDGQHRVMAAMLRDPEMVLPCIVYHGLNESQEAGLFAELQRERRQLRPHDLFWADVVAGDKTVLHLKDIVESVGYRFARKEGNKGHIYCYSNLRRSYDSDNGVTLQRALLAMAEAWGTDDPPRHTAMRAVHAFVVQYQDEYDHKRLVDVLTRTPQVQFEVGVKQFKEAVGTGYAGASTGGRYVQAIYNKGKRSNKLPEWRPGRFAGGHSNKSGLRQKGGK